MGRLQTWGAAARRSRTVQVVAAVVVAALVAGGIVEATRTGPPAPSPGPSPAVSTRVVALGDSVPYGHGLANPYVTPQIGLPVTAVSQGPSTLAYPSLVAKDLGLTMSVRGTNCHLTGDQLSISGAVADGADNTSRDGQCPVPPRPARDLAEQMAAADLVRHPARLVLLQDGADDIDFSACLEYQLARVFGAGIGLGHACVADGSVTPQVAADLANVRTSLAHTIETLAPHASTIAVLDYYQPIPEPSQIVDGTARSRLHTNLVCSGLGPNAAGTFTAARVVLSALNNTVAGAVSDARAHHVRNVTLVDVSGALDGHGMCTSQPWVFSGEAVPDTTLAADAERIVAVKACSGTDVLHGATQCAGLAASARAAERSLQDYVWRAAHPTAAGQRSIAELVEHRLGRTRSFSRSPRGRTR